MGVVWTETETAKGREQGRRGGESRTSALSRLNRAYLETIQLEMAGEQLDMWIWMQRERSGLEISIWGKSNLKWDLDIWERMIYKRKEYKEKKTQTKVRRTPAFCGLVWKEDKGDQKKKRQRNYGRSVGMPDITLTRFAAPPRHWKWPVKVTYGLGLPNSRTTFRAHHLRVNCSRILETLSLSAFLVFTRNEQPSQIRENYDLT